MDNKSLDEKVKEILKMMRTTKRSRMNAEKRLLKKDKFLKQIAINYSVFIIALSVINLGINSSIINYFLIIASLVVLSVSLYRGSENLVTRANKFKENYIKISKLDNELYVRSPENLNEEKVLEIDNEYQDILKNCDNHEFRDYHMTLKKCHNSYSKVKNFWWNFCEEGIRIIFLYVLPTIAFLYILFINLVYL